MKENEKQEALLQLLKRLGELGSELSKIQEEEESEDDKKDDEIMKSLEKDYQDFFAWAGSAGKGFVSIEEAKNGWEKAHPDLPLPRILRLKNKKLCGTLKAVLLIMDAYPLFVSSKF